MAGLSVILENYKDLSAQVISKRNMIKSPSSPSSSISTLTSNSSGFLGTCFLCNQRLLPHKDIYMYKGDRAFCSVECRGRQILMDEEESSTFAKKGCTSSPKEYNCSSTKCSCSYDKHSCETVLYMRRV